MKRILIAFVLIVALALAAGCTQSQPAPVPQPDQTQPPATQIVQETPAVMATTAPAATVTVVRYVETQKAWKDSTIQIAFRAPASWQVATRQVDTPEGSQGLEYKTELVKGDVFYIMTYPISRSQDQDYRNKIRMWTPAPAETTVTINGIVFERFESAGEGNTQVAYVARKSSANDIGFSSVIFYTADNAKAFQKDDFEDVIASFSYLTKESKETAPGTEIPRAT
jgi:predicted small lipoprotein YifL